MLFGIIACMLLQQHAPVWLSNKQTPATLVNSTCQKESTQATSRFFANQSISKIAHKAAGRAMITQQMVLYVLLRGLSTYVTPLL